MIGEIKTRWRGSVVIRRTVPFHESLGPRRVRAARDGDHVILCPIDGGEMRAMPESDAAEGRLRGSVGGSA